MLCRTVCQISTAIQRHFINSVRFASHYHCSARLLNENLSSHYFHGPFIRISSKTDAYKFMYFLKSSEQQILLEALEEHEKAEKTKMQPEKVVEIRKTFRPSAITREQMRAIFIHNFVPFIGFGLLDNLVMIAAGEYIDSTLGVILGISTTVFPPDIICPE